MEKIMAKVNQSGSGKNQDEVIMQIIKEIKDLKMENKYLNDVIDSLENNK